MRVWISLFIIFLFSSCISDIDFDQLDEVVITPAVDIDLVYFTVSEDTFSDVNAGDPSFTLSETTRLEFLNDDVVRENLKEIEIQYRVANSYRQSVIATSIFKNLQGDVMYEIQFPVDASVDGSEVVTQFTAVIPEEDIIAISNSIDLETVLEFTLDGQEIVGFLDFRSKAIYALEFSDL